MMKTILRAAFGALVVLGLLPANAHANTDPGLKRAIEIIRAVGPEGAGNAAATEAWKTISSSDASAIPALLAGMDGANELALNWLRAAVDSIASRKSAGPTNLPMAELGRFLLDTRHHPRARRLAFEWIARVDPGTAGQLISGLLNDPGAELRHEAVQKIIDQARQTLSQSNQAGATLLFQQALNHARDVDQIGAVTKNLKALGQSVDLPALFGFLTQWQVVGPFDSAGGKGFEAAFPPETKVDLAAEYEGKAGPVRWQDLTTKHEYGLVDLNKPCGALKGVAGYAFTEFHSPREQAAEIRLGCKNAWKIWLNGAFVFGRDEYHRGMEIDQYRLPVTLKAGRNPLLVKLCQNEQTEEWTKEWEFQLRITDSLGTPIEPAVPSKASNSIRN